MLIPLTPPSPARRGFCVDFYDSLRGEGLNLMALIANPSRTEEGYANCSSEIPMAKAAFSNVALRGRLADSICA